MGALNEAPPPAVGNQQMIRMESSYPGSSTAETDLPFVKGLLCHLGL